MPGFCNDVQKITHGVSLGDLKNTCNEFMSDSDLLRPVVRGGNVVRANGSWHGEIGLNQGRLAFARMEADFVGGDACAASVF